MATRADVACQNLLLHGYSRFGKKRKYRHEGVIPKKVENPDDIVDPSQVVVAQPKKPRGTKDEGGSKGDGGSNGDSGNGDGNAGGEADNAESGEKKKRRRAKKTGKKGEEGDVDGDGNGENNDSNANGKGSGKGGKKGGGTKGGKGTGKNSQGDRKKGKESSGGKGRESLSTEGKDDGKSQKGAGKGNAGKGTATKGSNASRHNKKLNAGAGGKCNNAPTKAVEEEKQEGDDDYDAIVEMLKAIGFYVLPKYAVPAAGKAKPKKATGGSSRGGGNNSGGGNNHKTATETGGNEKAGGKKEGGAKKKEDNFKKKGSDDNTNAKAALLSPVVAPERVAMEKPKIEQIGWQPEFKRLWTKLGQSNLTLEKKADDSGAKVLTVDLFSSDPRFFTKNAKKVAKLQRESKIGIVIEIPKSYMERDKPDKADVNPEASDAAAESDVPVVAEATGNDLGSTPEIVIEWVPKLFQEFAEHTKNQGTWLEEHVVYGGIQWIDRHLGLLWAKNDKMLAETEAKRKAEEEEAERERKRLERKAAKAGRKRERERLAQEEEEKAKKKAQREKRKREQDEYNRLRRERVKMVEEDKDVEGSGDSDAKHGTAMQNQLRKTLTCKGDPVVKRLEEYLSDFIDVDPDNLSGFILSPALENRHDMYVLQDDSLKRKTTGGERWARRCLYKDSDHLVQLLDSKCSPSGVPLLDFFGLAVPRTPATKAMFAAMIRAHREQSGAELREWAALWGGKWESTGTPGRFLLALPPWSSLVKRSALIEWLSDVVGTCEHAPVCRFANRTGPKDDGKDHAGSTSGIVDSLQYEFASGLSMQLRTPDYYTEEQAADLPRTMETWDAQSSKELAAIKGGWSNMIGVH